MHWTPWQPWLAVIATIAIVIHEASAEHWAVIVAGSKGYENYRHQADACHAYHVVRRHGIPEENVILMMYDDVATAATNPFPGTLYNKPSSNATMGHSEAMEVYTGCHVDYRGDDVTPEMFMHVLQGNHDATQGRKVLRSGASDRVFINFIDHGARGTLFFPHGQMLTSNQLMATLRHMHSANLYKELVFYVEGSMFWSLSMSHLNAFVTTASNGWESSWAAYCPPMDLVKGTPMNTCLGDVYSINWMEDSDRTDLSTETMSQQFQRVKRTTTRSHVEEFGSRAIRKEIVGNFQSTYDQVKHTAASNTGSAVESDDTNGQLDQDSKAAALKHVGAVDAHDVSVVLAFYRYLRSEGGGNERRDLARELINQVAYRERVDAVFGQIKANYELLYHEVLHASMSTPGDSSCHRSILDVFHEICGAHISGDATTNSDGSGPSAYSLQYLSILLDLCNAVENRLPSARQVLSATCGASLTSHA